MNSDVVHPWERWTVTAARPTTQAWASRAATGRQAAGSADGRWSGRNLIVATPFCLDGRLMTCVSMRSLALVNAGYVGTGRAGNRVYEAVVCELSGTRSAGRAPATSASTAGPYRSSLRGPM